MTARIKPLIIYTVERSGGSLTLHAIPVVSESRFFYYLPPYAQPLFHFKARVPIAKAHRSRKAAWTACFAELDASRVYFRAGIATLDSLIAQIPKRMLPVRHPRKAVAA